MNSIQKGNILHQVYTVGKEEARRIIDKAKATYGDDKIYIDELEKLYNEK